MEVYAFLSFFGRKEIRKEGAVMMEVDGCDWNVSRIATGHKFPRRISGDDGNFSKKTVQVCLRTNSMTRRLTAWENEAEGIVVLPEHQV
jgi:hypothetical protein